MRIEIKPHIGINHIQLDTPKAEFINNEPELYVEFKNQKVSTISFRNQETFTVGTQTVDIGNVQQWLQEQDPYFDGSLYIFPELNIAAYGLDNPAEGFEITAYADAVRSVYEKELDKLPRYSEKSSAGQETGTLNSIIPYKGVGSFLFGMPATQAIDRLGKPNNRGTRSNNTELLYWDKIILRFENNGLVQVSFENATDIFLEEEDISQTGPAAGVLQNQTAFTNRAYQVYFDAGIAFTGFDNTRDPRLIIVFAEQMKPVWSNTKRPLI